MSWLSNFEDRQVAEIKFSRLYARDFGHGTDGHNAKLIVAKMADLLDAIGGEVVILANELDKPPDRQATIYHIHRLMAMFGVHHPDDHA